MTFSDVFTNRWQPLVQRHLLWVFLLALMIAFVPMTLAHFTLKQAIISEEETANIINVAGRQRMLSQRLTLFTNRLATEAERGFDTTDTRETIAKDLAFMVATHERLAFDLQSESAQITEQDLALERVYFDEPWSLNRHLKQFVANIEQILSVPDYAVNAEDEALQEVNTKGPTILLDALNEAVSAYEERGYLAIQDIKETERTLWGVTALILLLEFFLIYLPVHNLIRRQVAKLSSNEQLFRSIYEKSPIMLHSIDRDGKLQVVSNYWLRHMGYEADEVLGQHLSKFMTEDSSRRALEIHLPKMIRDGQVSGIDYQMIKKNGDEIDVVLSAQSQLDENGAFVRSFAAMVDVTVERAMQAEMEKNAEAMQAFHKAASTPGLTFEERIHRVLRFGNVFFETSMAIVSRIEGDDYTIEYSAGPGEIPPPGTVLNGADTYCVNMLQSDQPTAINDVRKSEFSDHPCYRNFGLDTYIGVRLMVRGEPYGTLNFTSAQPKSEPFDAVEVAFIGLIGQWISSSIEQQLVAGDLTEARFAAETANATKSAFLANMSHEIRTPLNAVIGLTELTLKTELEDTQRYNLERVSDAGKNLLGIINDILDFSKIEAGKLEIEITEFELDDVLKNLSALVGARAEEKGLEILIWVDPDIPRSLKGDPLRVGQVLVNLLSNAIKFTDHGEIVVRAELREQNDDRVGLTFRVTDSGIGMNDEQVSKLFRPFVQADQSTTRMFGGTGLGLSISKQLIGAMGGTISVTSTEGEGSTFSVDLAFEVGSQARSQTPVFNIDPARVNVLIVDDNDAARDMLDQAVHGMGFQTETAASGDAALKLLAAATSEDESYDLILLDWKMPKMDGVETAAKIREMSTYARTPTVFMISSHSLDEVTEDLAALDIRTFLPKPINTSHLLDKMMEIFSSSGSKAMQPVKIIPEDIGHQAVVANARILLAEDNELNQAVAVGILEGAGFSVDVVTNGRQAIDKLREEGPGGYAVVLMDIQMPELDGITATRLIRVDDAFADLPIIAMTAHALVEERKRCEAAGMSAHISKPVDSRELVAKVNSYIRLDAPTGPVDKSNSAGSASGTSKSETVMVPTIAATEGEDTDYYDLGEVKARLMLPEDTLMSLVERFVNSYADVATRISDLIDEGKIKEAAEMAHSVKGVAGSLGATIIYEKSDKIDEMLKNEQLDDLRTEMPVFKAVTERTIAVMRGAIAAHRG